MDSHGRVFRLCALPARQVETGAWRGAEFFEAVIETTEKFIMSSMGEAGKHYVPLLCGMLIYIFAMNILGPHTWLRCANRQSQHHCLHGTFVFVYYNWVGLCRWKTHYINQFLGPNKWLILLMFPTGNRIAPIAAGFSFSPSFRQYPRRGNRYHPVFHHGSAFGNHTDLRALSAGQEHAGLCVLHADNVPTFRGALEGPEH